MGDSGDGPGKEISNLSAPSLRVRDQNLIKLGRREGIKKTFFFQYRARYPHPRFQTSISNSPRTSQIRP